MRPPLRPLHLSTSCESTGRRIAPAADDVNRAADIDGKAAALLLLLPTAGRVGWDKAILLFVVDWVAAPAVAPALSGPCQLDSEAR